MYLVLFFIIVGVVLMITALIAEQVGVDDDTLGTLGMLGVVSLFLLSWFVPLGIGVFQQHPQYSIEIVEKRTLDLISIKDNFRLSGGTMFVGISQDMYYYFYTQELGNQYSPDGAITLNKVYVKAVKLYEDAPEGTGYFIERWRIVTFSEEYSKWSVIIPEPDTHDRLLAREIHVPPGTVSRQFLLNAE